MDRYIHEDKISFDAIVEYLTIILRGRRWIHAELVIIILYPASPSKVMVLLKTPWCARRNYSNS